MNFYHIKTYYRAKRAVSPVIAVVLMIALTVAAAATIWAVVINKTEGSPELVVTSSPTFSDSGTDPDLLADKVTFIVENIGNADASLESITMKQPSNSFVWTITAPTTVITPRSEASVIVEPSSLSDQLVGGTLVIEVKYTRNILTIDAIVPSGESVDVYYSTINAYAYQDECTCTSSNMSSLIADLDGTTAPAVPDGTVNKPYFATGGSNRYYDAAALKFDVGTYNPNQYTATLRIFIFDGGYSTTWHHYQILKGETNTTNQDVGPPAASTPWDDGTDNGPNALQIDITLKSFEWSSGSFWVTLRLWDAKVDQIQLIITPTA